MSNINVAAIELDESAQCRAEMNQDVIVDYSERMSAGDEFPPIEVFGTRKKCWIGDGWHRVLASRENGDKTIAANLHPGGRTEAIKHALNANATHGLKRSNADKRRAVEVALAELPKLSNVALAEMCGISDKTVAAVRDAVSLGNSEPRTGRDGKTYPATRRTPTTPATDPDDIHGFRESDVTEDHTTQGRKETEKAIPERNTGTFQVSDAEQYANMAIMQLKRILDDDPNALKELTRVSDWIEKRKLEL